MVVFSKTLSNKSLGPRLVDAAGERRHQMRHEENVSPKR
jgi:hypothetical protein